MADNEVRDAYMSVCRTLAARVEWEHDRQRTASPPDVMREVRFLMAAVARADNPSLLSVRAPEVPQQKDGEA